MAQWIKGKDKNKYRIQKKKKSVYYSESNLQEESRKDLSPSLTLTAYQTSIPNHIILVM